MSNDQEYYKTRESVEEYIGLARDVSGQALINQLQMVLPKGAKLLEIGSGPGTDWNILKETYNVTGSDFSREFIHHLETSYPEGDFIELNAITLETDLKFDGIYSNKVLHHLKDKELINSINRQYQILNPGGIISHSFWKGEGSEVFKGMYVNYHTAESLKQFFGQGFEIIEMKCYKEFEDGDSLFMIGRKK